MRQFVLIFGLAVFWGIGGLIVGVGLDALFGGQLVLTCASLNVIVGLLLLLITTRNEHARRLFYEGPRGAEPGLVPLALLWAFPIVLVFLGLLWWLLAQFFRY
jgi:hypothetical protein